MRKITNFIFWLFFLVITLGLIYNSVITKTDFFYRYKFGNTYNKVRFQKRITLLPEDFVVLDDKSQKPLLVWINPKITLNDSSYTHIKKTLTVRNSELLLEEDLFKIKNKNSTDYKLLIVKYYYNYNNKGQDKEFYIYKEFLKDKVKKCDTPAMRSL